MQLNRCQYLQSDRLYSEVKTLDRLLPQDKPSRVRVILLMPEEDDLNKQTWVGAISTNPSFAFLHDPEEDIYSLEDGQPVNYEG